MIKTKPRKNTKKRPLSAQKVDEFGDIGYKTLIDFRTIDKDGVDIRLVLEALRMLNRPKAR